MDETLLHHFLIRHFDEDEMRERLAAAAQEKTTDARTLAVQADREEQEAVAALARIRRDYVAGKISADDWNDLRAELEEAQTASRNNAAQLRARALEIQAEAAQVDVEAALVARLGAVMQAVAGKADSPEAIAELRAALTATFERIVYQPVWRDVPEGAPIVLGQAELAPVLRPDLLATPDTDSCAHERVRSGISSAELEWPQRRITVNLAPAALRKEGSGFDLPIALAVLAASRQLPAETLDRHAAIGELALDGRIRPVGGVLAVAEGALGI